MEEAAIMIETEYRSIGTVAAELGIPRWRLAYLIERGDVPGPSLQVPGRRLFTDADVEKIRLALASRESLSS
jgi:DNA-binding transcriptional MerR regulator